MNGGFSARPCLGLAPADGGLGAHLFYDLPRMLAGRASLLDSYPDYFDPEHGVTLLWLEPWDGTTALDLRKLDPYFVEICRRVRLLADDGRIVAWTARSTAPRVAAKDAHGNLGDFWTPVDAKDAKALSLSSMGFRYDRLAQLILNRDAFALPPAMRVGSTRTGRWRVVARGVAGGQGKTDGYHERNDIAFDHRTTAALGRREQRDILARLADAQVDEIHEVEKALRFGIGRGREWRKARARSDEGEQAACQSPTLVVSTRQSRRGSSDDQEPRRVTIDMLRHPSIRETVTRAAAIAPP